MLKQKVIVIGAKESLMMAYMKAIIGGMVKNYVWIATKMFIVILEMLIGMLNLLNLQFPVKSVVKLLIVSVD